MVGLALAAISVFLGAGGGPLNVACMVCLFSFPILPGGEREEGIYRALMVAITLLSGAGGVLSLMGL
jgi:hypothetical protein